MHDIETVLGLLVVVAALAWLAARVGVPYPILLVVGGLAISLVPNLPVVELRPDIVFILFLPPLLYHAGLNTSWRDFRANLRSILLLAIGLVLLTTVAIAAVARYVIGGDGMGWASAFALGAIVSPPDAVAAVAITRRLRIPRRIATILEGESLVNDATALVAYKFAVVAVLAGGALSPTEAAEKFLVAGAGGVAVGLLVGVIVAWVRPRLHDAAVDSVVSLLTPFIAYLPAEWLGVSGVLAAVTAGLYMGRRLPRIVSSGQRLRLSAVWDILVFLLNGLIFVLIGLQLPVILRRLRDVYPGRLLAYALLVSLAAVVVRLLWVFAATYLPRKIFPTLRHRDPPPPVANAILVGWTGMRGIVSLAAALALPVVMRDGRTPFPGRDLILFLTFAVIFFTLVVQGLTLPPLIRWLKLPVEDDQRREEELARLELTHAALARLTVLSLTAEQADDLIARVRQTYRERLEWLNATVSRGPSLDPSPDADTTPLTAVQICTSVEAIMREALLTERLMLVKLRDDGAIGDEVLRQIQRELDLEESKLDGESDIG